MKGRKPKPTAVKKLRGNPGRRPLNAHEPTPKRGAPSCPAHLTAEAKREWRRLVGELDRMGLVTTVDRAALAAYCQSYARWAHAEKMIVEHGHIVETPNGMPVQGPWVGIANKALELMHKYLTEFGMTPSSRSRVNVKPPSDDKKGSGGLIEFNRDGALRLTG